MKVIQTENLSKTFRVGFFQRRVEAVRGLNLEVDSGEIFGFLGPNGAGKTTTIKMLLSLIYPTAGQATLLGRPLGDVKARRRIGFLPEQPYFYDYLAGREFLDFFGRFFELEPRTRRQRVDDLLERVGLAQAGGLPLRKYSKGMLQRIGMAQALLNDPELVILDEPMSGLDPRGRKEIRDLVLELKKQGKTVFFSTHILPDVEMICDRVGIIYQGRLVQLGRLDQILSAAVESVDLQVKGLDPASQTALEALGASVLEQGGLWLIRVPGQAAADQALELVRKHHAQLIALAPHRETLEEYFLRQIGNEEGAGS
jgi:ABC-2 type transport system ATP-binding protein